MSRYLRPAFTASLTAQLLSGACINLTSPHGQGRRRTVQDVRLAMPASITILHIDMRTYQFDYKGFYNFLHAQVTAPMTTHYNFDALLDYIETKYSTSLLILHNFDEIKCSETAPGAYNNRFFQALNSISKRTSIALLCLSERIDLKQEGSKQTDPALSDFSLNAKTVALPPLTTEQLLAELQRRALPYTEQKLHKLAAHLRHQAAPYSALDHV